MAEEKEELIPVGPGVEDEGEEPKQKVESTEPEGDARTGVDAEENMSDEEREARRQERRERKERQHAARERDKRELEFYRIRNEELEKRFSNLDARVAQSEATTIDQRLTQIRSQIQVAEQVHAKAVSDNAGDDATEALRIRDQLRAAETRLQEARERVVESAERRRSAPAERSTVPPALVQKASAWMEKNNWYKPDRSDEDSAIVGAIDDKLMAEGRFDPTSDAYYQELTKRVQRRLPERFQASNDDDDDEGDDEPTTRKPSGGPKFMSGGRERTLRKNEVYVTPERKAAMIESGAWEDPVLRAKLLKRYQQYDKDHSQRNAR